MAGDGVGVDEQDALTAVQLERCRQAHCDRRLADAALRVEDRDHRCVVLPVADLDALLRLDDRTGAVVDRHRSDTHRLYAPAQRFHRVRTGEELVAGRRA